MIRINTAEGTFNVPGAAKDVTTTSGLKIHNKGDVVAEFQRWNHWIEIPDTTEHEPS